MFAPANQATLPDDPGPQAADPRGHGQALDDFIKMGTGIARHLHAQADAQAAQLVQQTTAPVPRPADAQSAPAPAPDALIRIAASFDQIARAVRRCIAQAQNLNAPKQQQPARNPPVPDRTTARKRIFRAIEDVIQRPPDNDECDDAEVLLADLYERMDAPDLDNDIADRPVEDIIRDILRDLGLAALPGSRPWKRRTQADIADLNAHAAAPSSPARSAPRPPGPEPQASPPAAPDHSFGPEPAGQEPSPPNPAQREPGHPAAPARPPVRPGHTLPEDPAEAVAFVLHQAAQARWRPPPGD